MKKKVSIIGYCLASILCAISGLTEKINIGTSSLPKVATD